MGDNETDFWKGVKATFGGWKALVIVAVVSVAGTAYMGELWQAPETAQQALATAHENGQRISQIQSSIQGLERTVRIYLCTREDLDLSARVRLNCREFE